MTDVLPHGGRRVQGVVLLRKVADLQAMPRFDVPGVHRLGPGDKPQQSGLACSVETQYHHPGPAVDGQINAGENLQ